MAEKYSGAKKTLPNEEVNKGKGNRTYQITFNQNRSFDLHVNRQVLLFREEKSQIVTEDFINHPDFIQQSGYFTIKEIE